MHLLIFKLKLHDSDSLLNGAFRDYLLSVEKRFNNIFI